MKIEIDDAILADADAFDRARADKPITATAAVHAVVPAAAVMDEGDEARLIRYERDAAIAIAQGSCLRVAGQETVIATLRLALAAIISGTAYDFDGDSLTRGERLDRVRKIAQGALAGEGEGLT